MLAAGSLGLLPWAARAQARPLRYADMHSHVGLGNRDGIYARLWAHQSGGFLGEDVDDEPGAPVQQVAVTSI